MKIRLTYLLAFVFVLAACGGGDSEPNPDPDPDPNVNVFEDCPVTVSGQTLDIATWNIENYPKTNSTLQTVTDIIENYDLDLIALQEITSQTAFNNLVNELDGWEGFITQINGSNLMLAYLYKTSEVTVNGTPINLYEEATEDNNDAFTAFRRPYLIDITHSNGLSVKLINVHLKCCNGSEDRRRKASDFLKTYIDDNLPDDEVVILGDFNDEIVDSDNVFQNFLDDSQNYDFTTLEIAQGPSTGWSFQSPTFSSQIDQVLITNELFDNETSTSVLALDDCLSTYEGLVSDHRPVLIRFSN